MFGEGIAQTAVTDRDTRVADCRSQTVGACRVALQQVVGHALRRFRPDAWQHPQRIDQGAKSRRRFQAARPR
jgi:hypothetical protein